MLLLNLFINVFRSSSVRLCPRNQHDNLILSFYNNKNCSANAGNKWPSAFDNFVIPLMSGATFLLIKCLEHQ